MPEYEITFKKRFRLRDDQQPEQVARMYLDSMGFEFVDAKVVETPVLTQNSRSPKD